MAVLRNYRIREDQLQRLTLFKRLLLRPDLLAVDTPKD
jgi:hypothetical protein